MDLSIEETIEQVAMNSRWSVKQLELLRKVHGDEFIKSVFVLECDAEETQLNDAMAIQ
ncbi:MULTISPECIES: hypothetical protein [Levilactobacillus]|uniref:Antitoxin n=1 Tax=Levilactobacillus tongjiangensis TaxID=2486023 RepID=A0ABW1SV05_9LACO|nr:MULTISPECIES: hypothetical protein [Levilactobacillus]